MMKNFLKTIFGVAFFFHVFSQALLAQTTFIKNSPFDSKQYFSSRSVENLPATAPERHNSFVLADTLIPAWIYHSNAPMLSSPNLADLDGDGIKDIIFTTFGQDPNPYSGGFVFAVDKNGADLPGWPVQLNSPVYASAAVGDIDNDNLPDLVVGSWSALYAWDGAGVMHSGFPINVGTSVTPTLFDLDRDHELEIIYPADNQFLYIYNSDGSLYPGWPVSAPDLIGSPAIADIDNDGAYEIVAGTYQGAVGPDPFQVYAWELDGSVMPGFPVSVAGVVKAAPALGDLDGDGLWEITAVAYHVSNQDSLYVWDVQGNLKPGFPVAVAYGRLSSPALGDIDRDGDLEIVLGGWSVSPVTEVLFAFHHDGSSVANWPVLLNHPGNSGNVNSSPIIADIDGDAAAIEILVRTVDHIFALHGDGALVPGYPYFISDQGRSGTFSPSPVVGDADNDGDIELVFAASFDQVAFFDNDAPLHPEYSFWPMYKHDAWNTASFAAVDSLTAIRTDPGFVPGNFTLHPNYPNPFNPATTIAFDLPVRSYVTLSIYNLLGERVFTPLRGIRVAGRYSLRWNAINEAGESLTSGIYFYRLEARAVDGTRRFTMSRRMILLR